MCSSRHCYCNFSTVSQYSFRKQSKRERIGLVDSVDHRSIGNEKIRGLEPQPLKQGVRSPSLTPAPFLFWGDLPSSRWARGKPERPLPAPSLFPVQSLRINPSSAMSLRFSLGVFSFWVKLFGAVDGPHDLPQTGRCGGWSYSIAWGTRPNA